MSEREKLEAAMEDAKANLAAQRAMVPVRAEIGELKAKITLQESRIAALVAIACSLLEGHPQRDVIETRLLKHLGPSLTTFGRLDGDCIAAASGLAGWVVGHLGTGSSGVVRSGQNSNAGR